MAQKSPRSHSPLATLEAAYDLDSDDRTWLANVAQTVRPFLDDGHGATAYYYDAVAGEYTHRQSFGMSDADIAAEAVLMNDVPRINVGHRSQTLTLAGAIEAARAAGFGNLLDVPMYGDSYRARGIVDCVALRTVEPGHRGIAVIAGRRQLWQTDRRTRARWARIAAHLAAARRLRAAAHRVTEAVLTPSGKVEHAEGDCTAPTARAILREAVLRTEAARQPGVDGERVIEAWTALVSGRWTLVDRFERDGRRYLVAHRNEIDAPDPRALTPRERVVTQLVALGKPNKLVAYELGLSESAVGTLVSTAMRKLQVRTRVELIQVIQSLS